ncbi:MAG: hypothetical protein HY614_01940 [Candidatus Rokubacteria bacterium]|nr:hypothetical protein [Candidatus Rokubacteria bacterium]
MKRSRTVYEVTSARLGRIRVVEGRRERRLLVAGDTLSVLPLDGDWARIHREYWWRALTAAPLPPRPSTLFVGLGGGTQLHLLRTLSRPRAITVIERDAAILRVAHDWFGLRALGAVEYLCGAAEKIVPWLAAARRRFDYIMEDAVYAEVPERAQPLSLSLVPLVKPRGVLVVNRHRRSDARALAEQLRPSFEEVRLRRVRRSGDNVLICCTGPL